MIPRRFCASFLALATLAFAACTSSEQASYVPKPKGYPRIDLPAVSYVPIPAGHPYQFEVNSAARVLPDTFKNAEPHWIYIYYPTLKATVQITYKPVLNDVNRLRGLLADAYKLTAKHNVKASMIEQQQVRLKNGLAASLITLEGEVPSQFQFVTTDSTRNFLRGALYFNTATANDSLAPVINYVRADMMQLLNTLRWK
ncbi:gliding motility lipoprotein GldD [Fibrella forsythiae]|uniref:Gliding motility lipoprotein GldD n=1 Tax=Fibrella forsythiae TaxID=2817061 RepID=A0ABS3JJ31_9BACT|nr:gliding motility lipoprotein GldD [Fibrella forsythiae]MBO0950014.1 gliding motility lipoprotein GldD [Fibrella forsythiae]